MNSLELKDGRQLAYELFGDKNGKSVIFHHGLGIQDLLGIRMKN